MNKNELIRGVVLSSVLFSALAQADYKVLIGVDPADVQSKNLATLTSPTPALSAALNSQISLRQTNDLTDAMRATRTQENDIVVGPSHVAASAISHHYQLLARQKQNAEYVLIARAEISNPQQMSGSRLYLTQQDSVRTYLAKAMVEESGLTLKSFKNVTYGKTSGAGLLALSSNMADVTVASKEEAEAWIKANPKQGKIIKITKPVPSGLAVLVKKSLSDAEKKKVSRWITSADAESAGLGKMQPASLADESLYRYIASLGILTPPTIPGVTTVDTPMVQRLIAAGITAVDTRSQKEFEQERIRGAIHAPYIEKSLKDRDFDARLDDYSAISRLPKDKPVIFYCNGPECWKSYKAVIVGKQAGIQKIYWYREGMPDWRENKMPVEAK